LKTGGGAQKSWEGYLISIYYNYFKMLYLNKLLPIQIGRTNTVGEANR